MGPGSNDDKEACVLIRIVSWGEQGLTYEADPKQYEMLVNELGLNCILPSSSPEDNVCEVEERCLQLLSVIFEENCLGDIFDATTGQVLRGESVKTVFFVFPQNERSAKEHW